MNNNRGFGPWPDEELKLDGGAWRLDPIARIVRWVPDIDLDPNWGDEL